MTDLLKDKRDCVCGCGLFGTPRKRPEGHIRGCECPRCRGKRNRQKGLKKQREARKALDEVKSGAQIKPAVTAWVRIEAQVQSNQTAVGSLRKPCRAVLMPDGWSDGLVMVRLSTWRDVVRPALDSYYEGV